MEIKEIKSELEKKVPAFAAKVAPLFQLLNWRWAPGLDDPYVVPSVEKIEKTLYRLIAGLTSQCIEVAAGGLTAFHYRPNEESGKSGHYGLSFNLKEEEFYV